MVSIPFRLEIQTSDSPNSAKGGVSPLLLSPGSISSSWKHSMDDLSKRLENICRTSPTRELPGSPVHLSYRTSVTPSLSPIGSVRQHSHFSPPRSPVSRQYSVNTAATTSPLTKELDEYAKVVDVKQKSIKKSNPSNVHKPVKVKHEISKRELSTKLAQTFAREKARERKSSILQSRPMLRRDSIRYSFRTTVAVDCEHFEDLIALWTEENFKLLRRDRSDLIELKTLELPDDVDHTKLMIVVHDGIIDIKEYPKRYIQFQSSDCGHLVRTYCPIMLDDDSDSSWKMVIHIPSKFQAPKVSVKTVDDKVHISARQHGTDDTVWIRTVIELPCDVDPMSVSAGIYSHHQLMLTADFMGRSRCFSC